MSEATWIVVVNDEEQYSIWPDGRPLPFGWRPAGCQGLRSDCLAWIERVWTDMRPRSLRERMAADAAHMPLPLGEAEAPIEPTLIDRLCVGEHRAQLELFDGTLDERLDGGLLHICFLETRGRTTVGVEVERCDVTHGTLDLDGTLTLDFVPLHCRGRFDMTTLEGVASLERR
jgi:MbtH protein